MVDVVLNAEMRSERGSRPAGRLRREGRVPAVVYGLGADPVTVTVPSRELGHILSGESGANTLIDLALDGDHQLTLARQIQRHPTRGELVHVDFVRIRRDQAVSAEVPVHLTGEAEGVKDGGLLEQLVFNVTVEAMPGNIPVAIEVDVSALAIGDQLHARDFALPDDVTTQLDDEAVVVQVAAPRVVVEGEVEGEEGVEPREEGAAAPSDEGPAAEDDGE